MNGLTRTTITFFFCQPMSKGVDKFKFLCARTLHRFAQLQGSGREAYCFFRPAMFGVKPVGREPWFCWFIMIKKKENNDKIGVCANIKSQSKPIPLNNPKWNLLQRMSESVDVWAPMRWWKWMVLFQVWSHMEAQLLLCEEGATGNMPYSCWRERKIKRWGGFTRQKKLRLWWFLTGYVVKSQSQAISNDICWWTECGNSSYIN